MTAIASGDCAAFDQALKDGANPAMLVDGYPVLCIVTAHCKAELLKSLLAFDLVDIKDDDNRTALMYAVTNGSEAAGVVFDMLLEAGCDINAMDRKGDTALDWAMRFQNLRAMTRLYGLNAWCRSDQTIRRLIAHKLLER